MSLAMSRFIRGFYVGVEYFVTCRLSCASNVTSVLGMGIEDEDVDTEVGTVGNLNCLTQVQMKRNRPLQIWSLQKSQSRGTMQKRPM